MNAMCKSRCTACKCKSCAQPEADPGMKKRGGGGTLLLVVEGSARSAQTRGVWGHAPPRKILKLRPFEMDSKVI